MSYAGNPSLSSDIQTRVLGTFEQTLGLAAEGSRQEALLGCDFVLRMDPHFEPARQLQERLRNSSGPVSVDDLLAPATLAITDPFAGEMAGDLRSRFQSLLDGRQFQELMTLAQQNQAAVGADPELMRIASEAQERLEAAPYVNKFLNTAREAARQGNREEAARAVEKIRALDPTHPAIAELTGAPASPVAPPAMPTMPVADPSASAPADAFPAGDAGFELSLDEPSLDTGFGTELPELTFDEPLLGFEESPAAPSLMDPELVSAADFQTDMLSSSSSGDSETDRRIKQLLDEGQTAYQAGDVQGAIDSWSRIFLIDIDHQEAARRIEQARKVKAESERQAEEVFHEGLAKLEAGDLEGAKQTFHRVLEIQPSYFAAREYLQQLEAGQVPSARPTREPAAQPALPTPPDLDLETAAGELKEEILIPPDPSELAAAERQKPRPKPIAVREGRARKTFVLVGSAVLVLALAGGAFVYLNKDRLFPNSQTEDPSAAQASAEDPIARALDLHKGGKTQIALAQLRRLPPDNPSYAKAQELISQWDTSSPDSAAGVPGSESAGPSPAVPAIPPERLALLNSARAAYQGGSYLEAIEHYETAQKKGRLDPSDAQMLASAKSQIAPIAAQINLFHQHEWEIALRDLWRVHEADPGNRDVTRLMVDSYYNLALRDLQRMDTKQALQNFGEARDLAPDDRDLQRQIAFAEAYQNRSKDMLYRIYVKHLPLR